MGRDHHDAPRGPRSVDAPVVPGKVKHAFPGQGKLPAVEEELRRLRAENKRLLAERDILKKAAAFFAKEAT